MNFWKNPLHFTYFTTIAATLHQNRKSANRSGAQFHYSWAHSYRPTSIWVALGQRKRGMDRGMKENVVTYRKLACSLYSISFFLGFQLVINSNFDLRKEDLRFQKIH